MENSRAGAGTFQWPYTLSPYDSGMAIEDVWPTLFFGVEQLEEIRRKAETLDWAKQAVAAMREEADRAVDTPPLLPAERIGWRHDFYSHTTAEHLRYDPERSHRFLDPSDQSVHGSDAQHRAWVLLTHERSFRMMRSLGVLYGLTGDERYAAWVAGGMRQAAALFPREDLREPNRQPEANRFGALYFHPLYDSQVLMLLANAYSLTRGSQAYSEVDHERVRTCIFETGMPSQLRFLEAAGAHNMTCYVSASLAVSGEVMGRADWIEMGLDHPVHGVRAMLEDGLRKDDRGRVDGFWFEGTVFYHFYTMAPMVAAFEVMDRRGDMKPEVRRLFGKMFEAPVRMCDPDLRLPCLGDLGAPGARSLSVYRHMYEYGAGRLNLDVCARALGAIYAAGAPRTSLSALAYGPDRVAVRTLSQRSTVLKASGVRVFRGKASEGSFYLLFRSGRHGAGHDHPDKLSIDLRALGALIAPDLGTAGYAVAGIHRYYRSTLAHNTLMVDERDQSRAEQVSLRFRPRSPQQAVGIVEDAYEGVRLERRIRFEPPRIWMEDLCTSEAEHRYGWIFHGRGGMVARPPEAGEPPDLPPLPEDGAFSWFRQRETASGEGVVCVDWRVCERVWLRLLATSDGPFEMTTGQTPGNPIPDGRGTVLLRAAGKARVFRSCLEVHRGVPGLRTLEPEAFESLK